MTTHPIGLLLEAFVALLLMVTVGYCFVLNRKLARLRSHHAELREVVAQLNTATFAAQAAIAGLKETTLEADRTLSDRLKTAARLSDQLGALAGAGERPGGGRPMQPAATHSPPAGAPPDVSPKVADSPLERFRATTDRREIERRLANLKKAS